MVIFHGNTHGGVIFSLGDMAFGAASNSHGQTAVALKRLGSISSKHQNLVID